MTKIFGAFILSVMFFAAMAVLLALPTMLLWNWLMPAVLGLKEITFLQALGINFLTAILFKSPPNSSNKQE